ncbi:MAG: STN domain-containing protein [Candidatus Binatia bacterium]
MFHIPAQPLANALVVFAERSGRAVMAPADLMRDKTAPAVEGKMSPLTALDRLLKGSGLKYDHSGNGALTIAPAGSTRTIERTPAGPQAEGVPDSEV